MKGKSFLVRSCLIFFLLMGNMMTSLARQSDVPPDFEPELSTPWHSVLTHIYFLQSGSYDVDNASLPFLHPGVDSLQARDLAVKLKQAWDARGFIVNFDYIPREANYIDSVSERQIFAPIRQTPGIFVERQPNGDWRYSTSSFDDIEAFHREVFPYGSDLLADLFSERGSVRFFGLYFWQHFGILVMIIISLLLHKLLTFIFNRLLYQGAHKLGYDKIVRPYLLPVAKPLSLFVVFVFIALFYPILQLPAQVSFYLSFVFKVLWPLFGILVFYKLVDVFGLYLESLAGKNETSIDNNVIPIIRKVLKVFVIVVGGLFILQNLDVNITALLAGLSIGGLALALAAQDTLKNLFGSIMIFIDKPFSVGHWITSGDIDGTVEEVGFRSTRVRSFRNSLYYVPNGKLADATIDNHGLRQFRRFFMHISVTYDTPPDLIEVFVQGLRKVVEKHPNTRKDFYIIEFNEMGDFSLKIMFYIFFAVPTWPEELRVRHEILIEVVRLAEKLGVRFAFPTQTMHMETFPDKSSLTPKYDMNMNEFKQVMEDYFAEKEGKKG